MRDVRIMFHKPQYIIILSLFIQITIALSKIEVLATETQEFSINEKYSIEYENHIITLAFNR